ncbi:FAD-dependent oxidoreductase [Pseudooceanicola atlanticus]|uniref:2-polyprenyl-6-methoxyphenol hydroxylase n=1 Tax=Pseudooceanicola atlanticus TaxID=1461694 RepID=A0A0A0E825_9RHOB|nr:NAD(P)/FAD-dependent oxidoreductase [Pseudooceanicola atlanticus]KGM47171.1 2-polyprenyl-6-methoxyphenol hydroxylase [Pseudooceanicola atlanticus]
MSEATWRKGRRVAISGAGPGGVSAALAMIRQGYDVRIYERAPEPKPLGGAVLLSTPVLAVMRSYGIDVGPSFGSKTIVEFRNNRGHTRARLPFNASVEEALGIPGWHYGVLRSTAFAKMLDLLPDGVIVPNHSVTGYDETDDGVRVNFDGAAPVEADILVAADGIRSRVTEQAFGDPQLFHVGLRVWLAWCGDFGGLDRSTGAITHARDVQASYFPMLHNGKPGWEWWIVEKSGPDAVPPADAEAHLRERLSHFADPLPRFPGHTNFDTQVFRWEIYNRPSLDHWTKGRMAGLGDAVHPVSPYAAYGMGMAIEDGYFLARALGGRDLSDRAAIAQAFARYEDERVAYVTHHVEFARKLGDQFHNAPKPVAWLRDKIFDNTRLLEKLITKDYLKDAEVMSLSLRELHVP